VAIPVNGTRCGARDVTSWLSLVRYNESPGMRYLEWSTPGGCGKPLRRQSHDNERMHHEDQHHRDKDSEDQAANTPPGVIGCHLSVELMAQLAW
jgi:hypothetical protein